MNTINPPVSLANPDNEHRVVYIQDVASQPDYEITQVSILPLCLSSTMLFLTQGELLLFAMKVIIFLTLLVCVRLCEEDYLKVMNKLSRNFL